MFLLPGDLGALIFLAILGVYYFLSYLYERYLQGDNEQYSQTHWPEIALSVAAAGPPRPPGRRRLADSDEIVFDIYIKENSKEDGGGGGGGGGCAICLEEYKDGETRAAITACNHRFHAACIKAWLGGNDNCPLCRSHVAWCNVSMKISWTTYLPQDHFAKEPFWCNYEIFFFLTFFLPRLCRGTFFGTIMSFFFNFFYFD